MRFGSAINMIQSRAVIGQPEPKVGMGATLLYWSDRKGATIIEVFYPGQHTTMIVVQEDEAIRTDDNGMSESQSYVFKPNPKGQKHYFRKMRDGVWFEVALNEETGRWKKTKGTGLRIGERKAYHDFSF
jgi:hypothetical protein